MVLEELSKQLLSDGKKEANSAISRAEAEKEKIISLAEEKKKQLLSEAKKKAKEISERQKSEILSAASIRAKQIIDEEKNAAVERALLATFEEMAKLSSGKQYEKLLKRLAEEGEMELGKNSIIIVNEKDYSLAKKIFGNVSKETAAISGGVIVTSKDGLVRVDNSFEAIFEQNKDLLKHEIFEEMFGKGRK